MPNANEYLEKWYPKNGTCLRRFEFLWVNNHGKIRSEITQLYLRKEKLSGSLDLSDFSKLEEIFCANNQLTEIILPFNNNLESIIIKDNLLTNFDFKSLNPEFLTKLLINDNNLENVNISNFSNLINLRELWIGNQNEEKIKENIYNRFYGSLESFKMLNKLKELDVSNTDIDNGVQYLPISLKNVIFSTKEKNNCHLKLIKNDIKNFLKDKEKFINEKMNSNVNNSNLKESSGDLIVESICKMCLEKITINLSKPKYLNFCSEYCKLNCERKKLLINNSEFCEDLENDSSLINWQNWRDDSKEFYYFTPKETQRWIQEGFNKEKAKEWGKTYTFVKLGLLDGSYLISFLQSIKNLNPDDLEDLIDKEEWSVENLAKDFSDWIKIFAVCNYCQRRKLKNEFHFFEHKSETMSHTNRFAENNLFKLEKFTAFCSPNCQEKNKNYAQSWLDQWYPKEGKCLREKEEGFEDKTISNFGKNRSEIIFIQSSIEFLSGSLNLSDFVNLKYLDLSYNEIDFLNLTKNFKLEVLKINNNNFPFQNPSWLSNLINLKILEIRNNNFFGSLEFTKNMNKLEKLDIRESKLFGLEYLPLSLKTIECDEKIRDELAIYGNSLILWQSDHPNLMSQAGKDSVIIEYSNAQKKTVISFPDLLKLKINKNLNDSINYTYNSSYSSFLLRDSNLFSWEESKIQTKSKVLPFRLYQISSNQIVKIENFKNIEYLSLSYVWGNSRLIENKLSDAQKKELDQVTSSVCYSNSNKMTKLGYKAWKKAIATCKYLGFEYLWIDQMCINQNDLSDKGNEVRKMGGCYGNCSATLISIDDEIGELDEMEKSIISKKSLIKVINSSWFARSWTFQEGLLSKQTIFMFDDCLIDGRMLAMAWGGWHSKESINFGEPKIFITPLGWSYGSQDDHRINLSLGEALLAIKNRERNIPIDGIYSILGLLPYGEFVEPKYEPRWCSACPNKKETNDCQHEEKNKEKYIYTEEELNNAYLEIIYKAEELGFFILREIFSWTGPRNDKCWYLPKFDENGSTCVDDWIFKEFKSRNIQKCLQGVRLDSEVFQIDKITTNLGNLSIPILSKWSRLNLSLISEKNPEKLQVGDRIVMISDVINVVEFGLNDYLAILIPNSSDRSVDLIQISLCDNKETINNPIFADLINKRIIYGQENIEIYQKLLEENNEKEINNLLSWNKWKIIHEEFTQEVVKEWKNRGFDYQQTYNLAKAFKDIFDPLKIDFYDWLRKSELTYDFLTDIYEESYLKEKVKFSKQKNRNEVLKIFNDKLVEIENKSKIEINANDLIIKEYKAGI